MIMWRTDDGVRLQARSGRDVTAAWGDLALAGHHLPAGTVLDGEAVITTEDGRISFETAQARAASSPTRAHRLVLRQQVDLLPCGAAQLLGLGDLLVSECGLQAGDAGVQLHERGTLLLRELLSGRRLPLPLAPTLRWGWSAGNELHPRAASMRHGASSHSGRASLSQGLSARFAARSRYSPFTTQDPLVQRPCDVGSPPASAIAWAPPRRSPWAVTFSQPLMPACSARPRTHSLMASPVTCSPRSMARIRDSRRPSRVMARRKAPSWTPSWWRVCEPAARGVHGVDDGIVPGRDERLVALRPLVCLGAREPEGDAVDLPAPASTCDAVADREALAEAMDPAPTLGGGRPRRRCRVCRGARRGEHQSVRACDAAAAEGVAPLVTRVDAPRGTTGASRQEGT
ncbi:hypothetical protein ABT150_46695 [Streptomyces mirabilis]|uniref:hypothetical protein n=1 Tax=Streptomyces mirabilis TaxID=68239 RepID=UPI0033264DA4